MKYEIKLHCYRDGTDIYFSSTVEAKNITEAMETVTKQANDSFEGLNFAEVIDVELVE
jgi:hypothetical protein